MKHSLKLDIEVESKKEAENIIKSIKPDLKEEERVNVSFESKESHLIVEVKSKDIVSMRAVINSILRLISIVEKKEE